MNGHNRLIRRNHTYYLRARIPVNLVYLAKKTQFWYSLKTNNYKEALDILPKESHKVNMKINLLKALDKRGIHFLNRHKRTARKSHRPRTSEMRIGSKENPPAAF